MPKRSVLLGAVCVIAVFTVTAWWQMRATGNAVPERPRPPTADPPAAQSTTGNGMQSPPARPVTTSTTAPAATTAGRPAAVAKKPDREADLQQMRDGLRREEERRQDPAWRKSQDEYHRRDAERTRADAMRFAGMTSDEVDRMFALWQQRTARLREMIANSEGHPADEFFEQLRQLDDSYQAQLRELLGQEKYERWQLYQASQAGRNEANDFQRQLTKDGAEAFDPHQLDLLAVALYTEDERLDREVREYALSMGYKNVDDAPPRSIDWQLSNGKARNKRIHDALAPSLSAGQLASLDAMLEKKLDYLREAIRYNESVATSK